MDVTNLEQNLREKIKLTHSCKLTLNLRLGQVFGAWKIFDVVDKEKKVSFVKLKLIADTFKPYEFKLAIVLCH